MGIRNKIRTIIAISAFWLGALVAGPQAQAAPAYGTRMPRQQEFFVGAQTHYVAQRALEGDNGEMRSLQHFLNISLGLTDWLTLDLKGGCGNVRHENEDQVDLSYATFVGGGYGFRLRVFEKENIKGVFGFQHISIHPYSRNIGETKHKSVLDDWQLSFLVSWAAHEAVTPYGGVKVSRMDNIHWENGERNRIKSDESQSWGVIVGADIQVSPRVWVNLEAQALDGEAVSAGLNFRF